MQRKHIEEEVACKLAHSAGKSDMKGSVLLERERLPHMRLPPPDASDSEASPGAYRSSGVVAAGVGQPKPSAPFAKVDVPFRNRKVNRERGIVAGVVERRQTASRDRRLKTRDIRTVLDFAIIASRLLAIVSNRLGPDKWRPQITAALSFRPSEKGAHGTARQRFSG